MRKVATGVANLGNTCFLSAVLQSLCSVRSFHNFLESLPLNENHRNVGRVLRDSLRALSFHNGGTFNPVSLIEIANLREKFFSGGRQQDAQEFMEDLMSMLDETAESFAAAKRMTKSLQTKGLLEAVFAEFDISQGVRLAPIPLSRSLMLPDTSDMLDSAISSGLGTSAGDDTSSTCSSTSDSDNELSMPSSPENSATTPTPNMNGTTANHSFTSSSTSPPASTTTTQPTINATTTTNNTNSTNGNHNHISMNGNHLNSNTRSTAIPSALRSLLSHYAPYQASLSRPYPYHRLGSRATVPTSRAFHRSNPFVGLFASQLRCKACKRVGSLQTTRFVDLTLSFPERVVRGELSDCEIEDCLQYFTTPETVSGVRCEHCHKRTAADKRLWIARPPRALCLHLRRLVVDRGLRYIKLPYKVTFDETLNLLPFCNWGSNVFADATLGMTSSSSSSSSGTGASSSAAAASVLTAAAATMDGGGSSSGTTSGTASSAVNGGGGAAAFKGFSFSSSSSPSNGGTTTGTTTSSSNTTTNTTSTSTSNGGRFVLSQAAAAAKDMHYQLVAVIVHHGTASGGHFTVFRRQPAVSIEGSSDPLFAARNAIEEGWYHFSDERVSKVTWREVARAEAYMLFYERIAPEVVAAQTTGTKR